MNWVIDDQHLGRFLRTGRRPGAARVGDGIFTTGYWYVRLCQAVLAPVARGVLSAPFVGLPPRERERALTALLELPDDVGLLSLRELAPTIGRLRQVHALNALGSEVVAASVHLTASVLLSAPSPRLEEALKHEGRRVRVTRAG